MTHGLRFEEALEDVRRNGMNNATAVLVIREVADILHYITILAERVEKLERRSKIDSNPDNVGSDTQKFGWED